MRNDHELRLVPGHTVKRPIEDYADDELMQLAAADVAAGYEALVRRHQGALRAYCARACGAALGDDVAQEVFVAVYRARSRYRRRARVCIRPLPNCAHCARSEVCLELSQ